MTTPDLAGPKARDARPLLGFRVGVTGHRELGSADPASVEILVGNVLDDVTQVLRELAGHGAARKLYADHAPVLRLISPLAEGADRLVARAAVSRGWKLVVPLPFVRPEYERDFPDGVAEFRTLLAKAEAEGEVVELDGSRAATEAAYLNVGRFVVQHSDLLIAIWNGQTASGTGGTGQIVEEAQTLGVPVVHIGLEAPHTAQLLMGETEPRSYVRSEVVDIIRCAVLPDWPLGMRHHARAAEAYFLRERVRITDVAPDFLYQGPFSAPPTWLGTVFPILLRRLGGAVKQGTNVARALPPAGPDNVVVRACFLHFQRADALATHYAEVHRSAFVLIYLFGSLSLVAAFTAQFLRDVLIGSIPLGLCATAVELLSLGLISMLFLTERHRRWRERWLDYRLLAEMLRQSDLLAQIGGTPLTGPLDRVGEMHPERGWVPWLAAAITRSVGVVGARYDASYLERVRDYAVQVRLPDQIGYHERTAKRNETVSSCLRTMSVLLFVLTLVAICGEFAWPEVWRPAWPAWLAGVLPAIAAASFGIRNQAEFEIVVHRSARLRERLSRERDRIAGLVGSRLTSAALGRAIQQGARIMQSDTAEWAAIFEVKESEVV